MARQEEIDCIKNTDWYKHAQVGEEPHRCHLKEMGFKLVKSRENYSDQQDHKQKEIKQGSD